MNKVSKIMLRVAAVVTLGAGFALAQDADMNNLKANIPFDFAVGSTNLPAGEYTIEYGPTSSTVRVRDERGHIATVLAMAPACERADAKESHLAFRVYGAKHHLASTWNAAAGMGAELRKTPAELESEMAGVPVRMTVLIARK